MHGQKMYNSGGGIQLNPRANNGKIMIQKWTGGGLLPISSGTFSGRGAAADTAPCRIPRQTGGALAPLSSVRRRPLQRPGAWPVAPPPANKLRRKKDHDHAISEKDPGRYDGRSHAVGRDHQYLHPGGHQHRLVHHGHLYQRGRQHRHRYPAVLPGHHPAVPGDGRRCQAGRRAADLQVRHRRRHRHRRRQGVRPHRCAGPELPGHYLRRDQLQRLCVPGPDELLRRQGGPGGHAPAGHQRRPHADHDRHGHRRPGRHPLHGPGGRHRPHPGGHDPGQHRQGPV